MTKYILAGGNDFKTPVFGSRLASEFKKTLDTFKILSCFFSSPAEVWKLNAEKWEPWFRKNVDSIESYDYATPGTFEEKTMNADILYFHGGNSELLLKTVDEIKNLEQLFKNKIVVGSSAGANMLAKNFWSSTYKKPGKGKAIVPVSIMVHYGAANHNGNYRNKRDWDNEETLFQNFIGASENILHLPEGGIKVFAEEVNNGD